MSPLQALWDEMSQTLACNPTCGDSLLAGSRGGGGGSELRLPNMTRINACITITTEMLHQQPLRIR